MRILLIANINSPHTRKWAEALNDSGQTVGLFSIDPLKSDNWSGGLARVFYPDKKNTVLPLRYIQLYFKLRKLIKDFKPDVLHAHYLTNYGFLASISGHKTLVSTAWGSDVYAFPSQSLLNREVLKFILKKSAAIISTSDTMKAEVQKYTSKKIEVLPFGIDFSKYQERKEKENKKSSTIACFKRLEKVYGIDMLIKSFAEVRKRLPDRQIKLVLYGEGSEKSTLQDLVKAHNLQNEIEFRGWIKPEQIYEALAHVDLCVYLSQRESFGVALIEAMAAHCPLVVANLPAFLEVAGSPDHALFVEDRSIEAAAEKMVYALTHPVAMLEMTHTAYSSARARYDLNENIKGQLRIYQEVLANTK